MGRPPAETGTQPRVQLRADQQYRRGQLRSNDDHARDGHSQQDPRPPWSTTTGWSARADSKRARLGLALRSPGGSPAIWSSETQSAADAEGHSGPPSGRAVHRALLRSRHHRPNGRPRKDPWKDAVEQRDDDPAGGADLALNGDRLAARPRRRAGRAARPAGADSARRVSGFGRVRAAARGCRGRRTSAWCGSIADRDAAARPGSRRRGAGGRRARPGRLRLTVRSTSIAPPSPRSTSGSGGGPAGVAPSAASWVEVGDCDECERRLLTRAPVIERWMTSTLAQKRTVCPARAGPSQNWRRATPGSRRRDDPVELDRPAGSTASGAGAGVDRALDARRCALRRRRPPQRGGQPQRQQLALLGRRGLEALGRRTGAHGSSA